MGNMSYCRFENTARAMEDCINALNESEESHEQGDLSHYEIRGLKDLLEHARDIIEMEELIEEIITNG